MGWRGWLAFEVKPGITSASTRDRSEHWRGLVEACRGPNGAIDPDEFDRWSTCLVEYAYLWGEA